MTTEVGAAAAPLNLSGLDWRRWRPFAPLLIGLAVLTVPTFIRLGQQTWSTELGAHGPIVLATGLWLLHYDGLFREPAAGSRRPWPIAAAFAASLATYVFGRAYDFISLEAFGLYGVALCVGCFTIGGRAMLRHLVPLLYLGFLIPVPGWVIDTLTAPLQLLVSHVATGLLSALGYPIERQGVALFIAQYQLLVEDACAGMNSLVGLAAISLFYIYVLHRASLRYAALLVCLILPIAVVVNILRVIALVLITYYFGDAAAQGFLHGTTGLVLFTLALLLMIGIDAILRRLFPRLAAQA